MPIRKHRDANATVELNDEDLLDREESERREYMRLERCNPQLRNTSYRAATGSKALVHAWERWWQTMVLARARGLQLRRHVS